MRGITVLGIEGGREVLRELRAVEGPDDELVAAERGIRIADDARAEQRRPELHAIRTDFSGQHEERALLLRRGNGRYRSRRYRGCAAVLLGEALHVVIVVVREPAPRAVGHDVRHGCPKNSWRTHGAESAVALVRTRVNWLHPDLAVAVGKIGIGIRRVATGRVMA